MNWKEQIDQYFDDPAHRAELVNAVSRLVAVKSVKGEPGPEAPVLRLLWRRD